MFISNYMKYSIVRNRNNCTKQVCYNKLVSGTHIIHTGIGRHTLVVDINSSQLRLEEILEVLLVDIVYLQEH